jgi:thiamine pyrophosphate-dependent acetolactate synthase large subunit-like protein
LDRPRQVPGAASSHQGWTTSHHSAVQLELPIKIVALKNDSLSEVRFERKLNYPNYGFDLPPIDFVAFAGAISLREPK